MAKHKWIKAAIKRPGALHKALGVKPGKNIPRDKMEMAMHSKDKKMAAMARLAMTLKKMHK